jgi:site-specific DNA recombinase
MIEAGTSKPAPFDVVIVHSFSRFFRDHFELEFYVRKLAKNGVKLVSITQEMGDDPMHVMMRQIMPATRLSSFSIGIERPLQPVSPCRAGHIEERLLQPERLEEVLAFALDPLFDEYQSKENAEHVLRALKENARQGFWNGSLPPIGYRVVAAEQRGANVKKKLEIDPLHADTVRLIYRLALDGDGTSGPLGAAIGAKADAGKESGATDDAGGRDLGVAGPQMRLHGVEGGSRQATSTANDRRAR